MAVAGHWTCTVDTGNGVILRVRNAPSLSGTIIGKIPDRSTVTASKEQNGWYWIDSYGGWSSGDWMHVSGGPTTTYTVNRVTPNMTKPKEPDYISLQDAINSYVVSNEGDMDDVNNLITKNLNGIFGIPYQFMNAVDQKVDGTKNGKMYGAKIVARMP